MAALILALAAMGGAAARPVAPSSPAGRWAPFIREAAAREHLPEDWIARVIAAESAGRTMRHGRPITSRAGAMGLMQLMPATWAMMRVRLRLGIDPFDPHDNILAGTAFLRSMFDRFGYPGLFGAYNAGPGRYAAHLRGAALPAETVDYLAELTRAPNMTSSPRAPRADLFVALGGGGQNMRAERAEPPLFALRRDPANGDPGPVE